MLSFFSFFSSNGNETERGEGGSRESQMRESTYRLELVCMYVFA